MYRVLRGFEFPVELSVRQKLRAGVALEFGTFEIEYHPAGKELDKADLPDDVLAVVLKAKVPIVEVVKRQTRKADSNDA